MFTDLVSITVDKGAIPLAPVMVADGTTERISTHRGMP